MVSNLTSVVIKSIGNRKEEIAKAVNNYESKLRDIERKINNEEVTVSNRDEVVAKAMGMIEEVFGYNLKDRYSEIKTNLRYNIK